MTPRASLMALALLAGCAAPVVVQQAAPVTGPMVSAAAMPDRASLRRIGYRNCDGYAMELLAPRQVSVASVAGQALYLRAYPYRAGGAIQTRLPGVAARIQQQTGSGWRDLPVVAAGSGSTGGATASVSLAGQLGQVAPQPGHYRLWLGQFSASRGGATCSMSPVWQFDIG
ncbi:hypothetical protein FNJ84_05515 [Paracoccus sp. M683]|uniref:hypothetical protein n=1 Tax=Paracoccus sp. M683 TaxID=2594268 RepID=UPI00117F5904|nr:hypothetical protein [Paracoccus sp. M683]TRW98238.1 hypothetical protein FNJ84_05515 [Paracoccus sp. M683]